MSKNIAIAIIAVLVAVGAIAGFYYLSGPLPTPTPTPTSTPKPTPKPTPTPTPTPEDTIPPNIRDVTVSNVTPTSFIISWMTDEPATTQIMYMSGEETAYVYSRENGTLTLQHAYRLADLVPHTRYYVAPISRDGEGNSATGDVISVDTPGEPLPFKVVDPEPESINLSPTPYFEWQESEYADKYVLEVATAPQFGDAVVYRKELNADAREHRVEAPLDCLKKYYYKISAVNEWGSVAALNTPNWFTTSIVVSDQIKDVAVAPDNTKAVVVYTSGKNVTVVSLTDPPHIIANVALPGTSVWVGRVAITYDSRYAVITNINGAGYTLDLNTLAVSKIAYDNPDIIPGSGNVIAAPNSDTAYLCLDLLNPSSHSREYIDYVVSVLDVPSAHVVDYIHVYERASVTTNPVYPYAISSDGTSLYVGCYTGTFNVNGKDVVAGFVEKIDLASKTIVERTVFTGCDSGPWDMELTPDNKYGLLLIDEGGEGYIWWWNMDANKVEAELKCEAEGYKSMAITPDGHCLVVKGVEEVSIISVSNHEIIEEHYCYRPAGTGLAVSSDGKFALVGGNGRLGILFIEQKS